MPNLTEHEMSLILAALSSYSRECEAEAAKTRDAQRAKRWRIVAEDTNSLFHKIRGPLR